MRKVNSINSAVLVAAVLTGALLTGFISARISSAARLGTTQAIEDATGSRISVRDYTRIVSTSTIADQVLIELVGPSRLLAVSAHTLRTQTTHAYQGKIGVEHARDVETIIELRPDIVFVNNLVDRRQVERLKDADLNVFDLGEMRGLETLLSNIRQVAAVLNVPQRGDRLVDDLVQQLESVSAGRAEQDKRRGLYVGIHGDRLFGGAAGTSFHDVLVAAGLIDVAAEAGFRGWPAYTSEQLLTLDPPWIVTNTGTEQSLCRHPGLQSLAACRSGQVRGVEARLLTDPGLGMAEAARAVHAAVYGNRR